MAFLAVLITFVVSYGLIRSASDSTARHTVGHYAELLANIGPDRGLTGPTLTQRRLRARFESVTDTRIDRVTASGRVVGSFGLPADLRQTVAAGGTVDEVAALDGEQMIVEARPDLTLGGGVVVVQPVAAGNAAFAGPLLARLGVSLLVGLAVAALVGLLLARRLARPLQRAAAAAHLLAAGEREVRLRPTGPAEVAEVAEALGTLAGALRTSEGRQRQFLLSVSHELRTPLTAIRGYAEALTDGVVPAADVPATGRTVLEEARRLERLVSDLLDLARLGAQDFRIDLADVDLVELLDRAAAVWADRCAREGVRFRLERAATPLRARSDPVRVRQVTDGLAENALRVTPSGAPLVLALRADPPDAVLEVRDGGPGLTDDDLAVAFERSALYDRYRGVRRVGTGVGLALVSGLVTRLGGSVRAGHAAEGGARFTVRLPLAGPADRLLTGPSGRRSSALGRSRSKTQPAPADPAPEPVADPAPEPPADRAPEPSPDRRPGPGARPPMHPG